MEKHFSEQSLSSNIYFIANLLMANLDYNSYLDYGIRTIMGGLIWFGFQEFNDYRKKRKEAKRIEK